MGCKGLREAIRFSGESAVTRIDLASHRRIARRDAAVNKMLLA